MNYYSVAVAPQDILTEKAALANCFYVKRSDFCTQKMTKLLKPIFARLRTEGFASTSFSDESLQVSESEAESIQNVSAQVKLFRPLAFVHPEKSVLASTQKINSVPRSGNYSKQMSH